MINKASWIYTGQSGFSIRNGVDGRIWEVGGEILKNAEGVFSERFKARASRGVRKFGSLRMHFPHSGTWIRLFEQNTDIIHFGLFLFNGTQKLQILFSSCQSLSLLLRLKHFKKSSLRFLWRRHACNLFKSRELYVTSRASCAAFAPRTHGLENMPGCSATERSIEEFDGRRAEITEISGNILFFFFLKKTSPIQGECFSWY